jgi:hypothetical protein
MGSSFGVALAGRTGACREVGRVIVRFTVGLGTRRIWGPNKWDVLGPCSVRGASVVVYFCLATMKLVVLYWYGSISLIERYVRICCCDWTRKPFVFLPMKQKRKRFITVKMRKRSEIYETELDFCTIYLFL